MKFQVGDVVEAFGLRGKVTFIDNYSSNYPITVKYSDDDHVASFTEDGKCYRYHKTPSLVLISRAKKKVTKTIEQWVNTYPDGTHGYMYKSESDANDAHSSNRIACVKLTGTYEVEE